MKLDQLLLEQTANSDSFKDLKDQLGEALVSAYAGNEVPFDNNWDAKNLAVFYLLGMGYLEESEGSQMMVTTLSAIITDEGREYLETNFSGQTYKGVTIR